MKPRLPKFDYWIIEINRCLLKTNGYQTWYQVALALFNRCHNCHRFFFVSCLASRIHFVPAITCPTSSNEAWLVQPITINNQPYILFSVIAQRFEGFVYWSWASDSRYKVWQLFDFEKLSQTWHGLFSARITRCHVWHSILTPCLASKSWQDIMLMQWSTQLRQTSLHLWCKLPFSFTVTFSTKESLDCMLPEI